VYFLWRKKELREDAVAAVPEPVALTS